MAPIYHELTPPGIWNYCSHCSTQRDTVNKTPRTHSNQQKHERKSTTGSENEAPFHESQWLPLLSSSSENVDELKSHLTGCREGIKGLMAPGRQWNFTIREGSDKHSSVETSKHGAAAGTSKEDCAASNNSLVSACGWRHWHAGISEESDSRLFFFLSLAAGGISVSLFSCAGDKTPSYTDGRCFTAGREGLLPSRAANIHLSWETPELLCPPAGILGNALAISLTSGFDKFFRA